MSHIVPRKKIGKKKKAKENKENENSILKMDLSIISKQVAEPKK